MESRDFDTNSELSGDSATSGTVDPADIARFRELAKEWWNPDGPHGPLHRFVPVRMSVIRSALSPLAAEDSTKRKPLMGVTVLDIGCGGGLLSEPMTRLGAKVTGVDADVAGIEAAIAHCDAMGLDISYHATNAERLVEQGLTFDAVVASEVVEHVADIPAFARALADLVRPGGKLVMTTINRTSRSYASAIVAAEQILRWVPKGTHDWNQFPTPGELGEALEGVGFDVEDLIGLSYHPLEGRFSQTGNLDVNYALVATREA